MCFKISSILMITTLVFGDLNNIEAPPMIDKAWEAKYLGVKYSVTTLDNSIHEFVDGILDEYFDKEFFSKLHSELVMNPSGDGIFIDYWPNGSLKARLPYHNGRAHGHIHAWFDNGCDAFKGHFSNGIKQGIHMTLFKGEYIQNTKCARILYFSPDGKLTDECSRDYPNGKLCLVAYYTNGLAHGPLIAWNDYGRRILEVEYSFGKKLPKPTNKKFTKDHSTWEYVNKVIHKFEKYAYKKYKVYATGSGSSMPYDIEKVSVSFDLYEKGNIKKGRDLIVNLTEDLTKLINSDEKLRPYLREYPFSSKRTNITLSFNDNRGMRYQDNSISYLFIDKEGKIRYNIYDKYSRIRTKYREPYETALATVKDNEAQDKLNITITTEKTLFEKIKAFLF